MGRSITDLWGPISTQNIEREFILYVEPRWEGGILYIWTSNGKEGCLGIFLRWKPYHEGLNGRSVDINDLRPGKNPLDHDLIVRGNSSSDGDVQKSAVLWGTWWYTPFSVIYKHNVSNSLNHWLSLSISSSCSLSYFSIFKLDSNSRITWMA